MEKPVLTIKNHLPFSLEGFRGVDPTPTLARALAILSKTELTHYLSAGTALGIHRDQGFIPHDTDIDLAIELGDWQEDHYQTALELVRRFTRNNIPCVRSLTVGDRPVQLIFGDGANRGMLVDIEFYYGGITDGKVVHYKPEGYITLPPQKTALRDFRGLSVPLPEPIEPYLAERYGDWETPTKEKGAWQDYTTCFIPWP